MSNSSQNSSNHGSGDLISAAEDCTARTLCRSTLSWLERLHDQGRFLQKNQSFELENYIYSLLSPKCIPRDLR